MKLNVTPIVMPFPYGGTKMFRIESVDMELLMLNETFFGLNSSSAIECNF